MSATEAPQRVVSVVNAKMYSSYVYYSPRTTNCNHAAMGY